MTKKSYKWNFSKLHGHIENSDESDHDYCLIHVITCNSRKRDKKIPIPDRNTIRDKRFCLYLSLPADKVLQLISVSVEHQYSLWSVLGADQFYQVSYF